MNHSLIEAMAYVKNKEELVEIYSFLTEEEIQKELEKEDKASIKKEDASKGEEEKKEDEEVKKPQRNPNILLQMKIARAKKEGFDNAMEILHIRLKEVREIKKKHIVFKAEMVRFL